MGTPRAVSSSRSFSLLLYTSRLKLLPFLDGASKKEGVAAETLANHDDFDDDGVGGGGGGGVGGILNGRIKLESEWGISGI